MGSSLPIPGPERPMSWWLVAMASPSSSRPRRYRLSGEQRGAGCAHRRAPADPPVGDQEKAMFDVHDLVWRGDGKQLAFPLSYASVIHGHGTVGAGLYVLSPDGRDLRRIYQNAHITQVSWPTSGPLGFAITDDCPAFSCPRRPLPPLRRKPCPFRVSTGLRPQSQSWSPDGQRLLMAQAYRHSPRGLFVAAADRTRAQADPVRRDQRCRVVTRQPPNRRGHRQPPDLDRRCGRPWPAPGSRQPARRIGSLSGRRLAAGRNALTSSSPAAQQGTALNVTIPRETWHRGFYAGQGEKRFGECRSARHEALLLSW